MKRAFHHMPAGLNVVEDFVLSLDTCFSWCVVTVGNFDEIVVFVFTLKSTVVDSEWLELTQL